MKIWKDNESDLVESEVVIEEKNVDGLATNIAPDSKETTIITRNHVAKEKLDVLRENLGLSTFLFKKSLKHNKFP